jgi:hypothetical protein
MSRVNINAVDASDFVGRVILKVEGIEKLTLVEVQPVNLVAGGCDDSVTRGVVVGNCSTGFGYARAMVKPALVMHRD